MYECPYMYIYVSHACLVPMEAEEGIDPQELDLEMVTFHVNAGNQTWKSSQCCS